MAGRTFDPAVRGNRPLEMSKPTYRELATDFTLWCKFVALASDGGDKLVARRQTMAQHISAKTRSEPNLLMNRVQGISLLTQ
jgi:hypothetical protein